MNLDQLSSFYLVATLGTFQKAAERLNSTQPAISARIASLETELNVQLFDRSGHRVALTPAGQKFLSYAEQMLELRTRAMFDLGQADLLEGVLRLGASDTLVGIWIPDFIVNVRKKFPRVNVGMRVRSSPLLRDDLLAQEIDIAFLLGPISHPAVINLPLCECPVALVAVPSLGLHGRKLSAGELEGLDVLTFEKMTLPHQQLMRTLRECRVSMRINPISALHSIILLTLKGLGIGVIPLAAIERELQTGELVQLYPPFELPPLHFSASYLAGPNMEMVGALVREALTFQAKLPASKFIKIVDEDQYK